jgi:phage tail sheath protein FI
MAERLHPGVYVEERTGGLAPIQGVSTSNFGIVGFTTKGPTDIATLETSYTAFARDFGDFTADSQVPTHVFAFFANGGRRAYVVRVVGSGATAASGNIVSSWAEESIVTGDGAEDQFNSASPNLNETDFQHTPIVPGTISLSIYEADTPVVGQACTENPTITGGGGALTSFTSRIVVPNGRQIVPGTVTINTTSGAAAVPYTDPAKDGLLKDAGTNVRGYIDYETGHFTLSVDSALPPDDPSTITADYTPVKAVQTVTDDGVGGWTGAIVVTGAIDYATGVWSLDITPVAPADQIGVLAAYDQTVWDAEAYSAGTWGNDLRLDARGDDDYFDDATATYSRYDVLVYVDGDLDEIFGDLSFTDPTDARYVADVLNNAGIGSSLVTLTEPSNEDVGPRNLSGYWRSRAAGGGNSVAGAGAILSYGSTDGTLGTPNIPVGIRSPALETPVQPNSVSFVYTDVGGVTRTITDDGDGNLIGDVDGTAAANFNLIDYDTGEFVFAIPAGQEVSEAETSHTPVPTGPVPGSLITATHYITAADSVVQDTFAGGTDGAALTRNEITDPALLADRDGMYALLVPDEIMNVAIPDAAGDVTMSVDQVTEAERNGQWFIILAPPPGLSPQQVKNYRVNTLGVSSSYAALYYPYITITDPVTDLPANVPPAGHIAGIYARTDASKSVGKAPAGVEDGKLSWSIGLERDLDFGEIDILHPRQINSLIDKAQTGRCVWGARTLENPPADFRFIHVRRLFNFLKKSIFNSTHGFVFENVGSALRSRIRLSVENFLLTLYAQGLFKGNSPSEAFAVICDESNNPPAVEQSGTVICDIYVAANVPGEFIVFRIQQKFEQAA